MPNFDEFHSELFREPKYLVREYRFYVGELTTAVAVRIWKTRESYGGCEYTFTQSHYMHTPTQAGPHMTSAPFGGSEEDALCRALSTFSMWYEGAVQAGQQPKESWLVPNEYF